MGRPHTDQRAIGAGKAGGLHRKCRAGLQQQWQLAELAIDGSRDGGFALYCRQGRSPDEEHWLGMLKLVGVVGKGVAGGIGWTTRATAYLVIRQLYSLFSARTA